MRENDEKTNVRHFRAAERFFCQNGGWWFSTREGDEGPFSTREQAKAALARYLDTAKISEKWKAEREAQIESTRVRNDKVDPTVWDRRIDTQ